MHRHDAAHAPHRAADLPVSCLGQPFLRAVSAVLVKERLQDVHHHLLGHFVRDGAFLLIELPHKLLDGAVFQRAAVARVHLRLLQLLRPDAVVEEMRKRALREGFQLRDARHQALHAVALHLVLPQVKRPRGGLVQPLFLAAAAHPLLQRARILRADRFKGRQQTFAVRIPRRAALLFAQKFAQLFPHRLLRPGVNIVVSHHAALGFDLREHLFFQHGDQRAFAQRRPAQIHRGEAEHQFPLRRSQHAGEREPLDRRALRQQVQMHLHPRLLGRVQQQHLFVLGQQSHFLPAGGDRVGVDAQHD